MYFDARPLPNLHFNVRNRCTYFRRAMIVWRKRGRIYERQVSLRSQRIFQSLPRRYVLQRWPMETGGSPFTPAFVVSQVISFEAAQHTNKLLANSTTEEQVHSPTSTTAHKLVKKPPGRSRPGTFLSRYCFLGPDTTYCHYRDICPASGQTCRCCYKTTTSFPRKAYSIRTVSPS